MSGPLRMLWSLFGIGAAVYAGLCLSLYFYQSRLVYFPTSDAIATPLAVGLQFEQVFLQSGPQARIHAWYVPREGARFTVLFCHGNAGNISHRLDTVRLLHELGLNVLIFDYAGYGQSTGQPSEAQTYQDGLTVWRYLTEVRALEPAQIVLFGRSLGAGIATQLATRVDPGGLVVESAFTSVPDLGAELYPLFPVRWLARIHYDNRSRLAAVSAPVMVLHSRDDRTIPLAHGEQLYEVASQPKQFLEMSGGHNDGFVVTGERYRQALHRFIGSLDAF